MLKPAELSFTLLQVPVAALVGGVWDVFQPLLFGLVGAEIHLEKLKPASVGESACPPQALLSLCSPVIG